MNKRVLLILAVFLFCIAALHARGGKEKESADNTPAPVTRTVQVTGVVRLVGSGLFTELVISGEEGQWYVSSEDREKLHNMQHQTVTVEGEETVVELVLANGRSAGIRRDLRNIRVLRINVIIAD